MNKNRFIFLNLLFCLTAFFSSCEQKWEEPEFQIPRYSVDKRNIRPISYIKGLHKESGAPPDSIIPPVNREIFIEGYVVSSDEGGNFFKSLVIQDKSGGIEMRLDKTGLYTEYPVGQKVFIDCRGLVIGDYNSYPQLGVVYQNGVGRLHQLLIPKHIHKDSLPDMEKMYKFLGTGYERGTPIKITNKAEMEANVGKLVMIPNCRFDEKSIGAPLAYNDIDYTNHTVYFGNASIVLRTSSYAKFRNSVSCLDNPFTLYGVISMYKSGSNITYQFTIRTAEDIVYDKVDVPESLESFTFNQNPLTKGWRVNDNTSDSQWTFVDFAGEKYMFHKPVSAGSGHCDDWLISPLINIENRNDVKLFLDHRLNSTGTLQDYYQVYYSVTDNGSQFDQSQWQSLGMLSTFPANEFALSNAFNISVIQNPAFRIAIRFHKTEDVVANRWEIRGVKFSR